MTEATLLHRPKMAVISKRGISESDDFDITDPEGSYDIWVVKTSLMVIWFGKKF